ncbi:SVWC domain-containing protein [Caerostris darwini]|uniref:SVWC domain-containing protein n=1 Tax=Caerostris darwini TaxID=1538125 RepID=A0AAV4UWF7_9ARAC|nr:SVWC domain-containing protein [Caerostris darwini]
MRASTAIPWIILIVLVFVSKLNAYTYSEFLNTDSGYCEGPSYGRIPVGDIGYDKENCERIECGRGVRHVAGCGKVMKPDDPRCRILQREGRYPDCCPDVKCDVKVPPSS